jgi:cobalt-zinc-cadmium resistance protein CzcA
MVRLVEAMIESSTRWPWRVLALVAALAVGAAWSLATGLEFDAFPDLTNTQVQVVTASPGMDSREIEGLVTAPIERAMGGVPGVAELRSLSRTGISSVTVVFKDGTDLWRARQLVRQQVDAARADIPEGAGDPELGPPSTGLGEVYQFTMRSDRHTMPELYRLFERDVAPRLRRVPGVVEVNAWGGGRPQLDVALDPWALAASGVSLGQAREAIAGAVGRASGGGIPRGAEQDLVRAVSNPTTPEDLEQVAVVGGARPVKLGELGVAREGRALTVGLGSADARGESIFVMVQLLAGADALGVTRALRGAMGDVRAAAPEGVEMEVVYARDELIERTLATVSRSLLEGGLLVVFVLFVLLGDWRAGLVVASVIPLSLLGALALLVGAGYSGNLMSLGAIDFGLVVDGSIVVTEAIVALRLSRDAPLGPAVSASARSVARPVLFAVGILILVYVPILTMWGTEGKLFRPMALTVLGALATALALSFTYVPALATLVVRPRGEHEPWLARKLSALYRPALDAVIGRPVAVGVAAAGLVAASAVAGMGLGVEFVPRLGEGDVVVQTARLASLSPDEALRGAAQVEAALGTLPEVERVASRTGAPAVATDPMGLEEADILVKLRPIEEWTSASTPDELTALMSERVRRASPGAQLTFTQPIEMRFNELLEGITSDVGVKIFGPDLGELSRLGGEVAARLERVPGAADVARPAAEGVPGFDLELDPAALARHGARAEDVLEAVAALRRGLTAAEVTRGGWRDPIVVRLARRPDESIAELPVVLPGGHAVPLGELARVRRVWAPATIERESGSRRALVELNVRGRDLGAFVAQAREAVDAVALPPGYWVEWGGKYEQLRASSRRVALIAPGTLLAIVALLLMAFGRARPTALILLNVPVAVSGGALVLAARGMPVSMSAVVGVIALLGVAVMNGVVLLSRAEELAADLLPEQAARQAALERFRPVVTTALVAGLGFVPMALAAGPGAEVQRPLATVVIGGLLTATPLTLLALPALYARLGWPPRVDPGAPTREDHGAPDGEVPAAAPPATQED